MVTAVNERSIPVDSFGLRLRSLMLKQEEKAILISDLRDSTQEPDIPEINCEGYGRVWNKSISPEPKWGDIVLPYLPAAWKLGISLKEASRIQVFQSAGCNYRCWFCFVDYKLLKADLARAKYFTSDELIAMLQGLPSIPRVIRLSGGQPDLTPEWAPWMMKALANAGLDTTTYLWLDDNLSNDYAWVFLRDEDWDRMKNYRNFGRVGCLKGFDPESFHFNTRAPSEHFYRQLDNLSRLVKTGLDVYVYLILTSPSLEGVAEKMERLLDRLQLMHPNLPLRVSPLKIKPYSPTVSRMNPVEEKAMEQNQFYALQQWKQAMAKRFSQKQLNAPCYEASLF